MQERDKLGLDLVQLVDENNQKQNVIFSAVQVKDEVSSLKMVKLFHEMGVKCNQPDSLNQTPLFFASRDGHNSVIDYLLKQGCDVNHIDTYGQTSIFYSVREGILETI